MTPRLKLMRRVAIAAPVALTAIAVLAGCGQTRPEPVAPTAGDRSALTACADAVAVVDQALDTVRQARTGEVGPAAAGELLATTADSLRVIAGQAADSVVGQSVQDLLDSITAYRAVLPDPNLGGYADVETDVHGRLAGFRNVCPVGNADFDEGGTGWAATTSTSTVEGAASGHRDGTGLRLSNSGTSAADIGVRDAANGVGWTWPGSYRAGVWARADTGSPTLSLVLEEKDGNRVVGSAEQSVRLGPDWTFLGVTYHATRKGGPLTLTVRAAEVAPQAGVTLDDLAIARG